MNMKPPKFWYYSKYHPTNLVFSLPSHIISFAMLLRRIFGKKKVLDFPSVGVGSLALGGAGKTTLSLKIAQILSENKIRPAVIHSGFGGKKEGVFMPETENLDGVCDETVLALKRNFIGASFKKREKALDSLRKIADALIFDDFFSYLLEPEIKILTFTKESIGNTLVFPFGPMREPIISALWTDMVFIEKGINDSFKRKIEKLNKKTFYFISKIQKFIYSDGNKISEKNTSEISGARAVLVSSIALPSRFRRMIREIGINIVEHFDLPDHSQIPFSTITEIREKINKKLADIVVSTEKDFWKITNRTKLPLYGVCVEFEIGDEEKFRKKLFESLSISK
ncbi:MAG: tetraacyldisaccharide 4'-kinase [bacterium]|nr:tetraacyldisaccharide 4'-kinase [bacterium]